jgi:hypothetical protein
LDRQSKQKRNAASIRHSGLCRECCTGEHYECYDMSKIAFEGSRLHSVEMVVEALHYMVTTRLSMMIALD